jgi:regulator of protease activity HflC (stomatin/prohibitin superfamily)
MDGYEVEQKQMVRIGWGIGIACVLLLLLIMSVTIIPAGNVGVVTRWGAVNRVFEPGFHMKWPVAEWVRSMSVRTQKDQVDVGAASRNLQVVTATIAVNYHLDGLYAVQMYQNVGTNYQDIVLAPAIQDIFKSTTAKFTAEELITKREEVRVMAEQELVVKLAHYNVVVESFNIVNFDFSPEFNAAIEAKQVQQQQVETARQRLEQAKIDAETIVTTAQGQADAQKAMNDTGGLTAAYIQYLAITKWNGVLPNVTGGVTPFIDVSTLGGVK